MDDAQSMQGLQNGAKILADFQAAFPGKDGSLIQCLLQRPAVDIAFNHNQPAFILHRFQNPGHPRQGLGLQRFEDGGLIMAQRLFDKQSAAFAVTHQHHSVGGI